MLATATAQSNWRTASKILNNNGSGYAPAACCCWRYCPSGTSQGDWYLPGAGEMAIVRINDSKIDDRLSDINSHCAGSYINSIGIDQYTSTRYDTQKYYITNNTYNAIRPEEVTHLSSSYCVLAMLQFYYI